MKATRLWWSAAISNVTSNIEVRQVSLTLFVLVLLRCAPMLWGQTLFFGDNFSLMVPGKIFTAQQLMQGELPFWNPYLMGGLPWLADINQSVLYFTTLFFRYFPPVTALNLTVVSHLILTFIGMYLLARQWVHREQRWTALVAAILWTCSTHITGSINNLSTIQSIIWIPWLAWVATYIGYHRWAPFLLASVVLLQFLGGYPQHVIYGLAFAVLLATYRWWQAGHPWKLWFLHWLIAGVCTVMITAIAWLPFARVLLESTRMEQTTSQAAVGSLPPVMLAKVVLPYIFDKPSAGMKWGPAWSGQPNAVWFVTGLGLLVVTIASVSELYRTLSQRKVQWSDRWLWIFLTTGTIIFALGENVPGFAALQELVPLFRVSRYPSMVLFLTNIVFALWIAQELGNEQLHRWVADMWQKVRWWWGALVAGMLLMILVISSNFTYVWSQVDAVVGGRLLASTFHTLERDEVIWQVIAENLVVAVLATTLAVWAWSNRKKTILVAVLLLEMLYATQSVLLYIPGNVYPQTNALSDTRENSALYSQLPESVKADTSARWLTRNSNTPYTDYGSYWEAWVVRAPFSDSFVDEREQQSGDHAKRLREGLTPDWNWAVGLPVIHGYTTLVPSSFAQLWQQTTETRINFIEPIELTSPLLVKWGVKYYLVDTWFDTAQDAELPPGTKLIAEIPQPDEWQTQGRTGAWLLYELPNASVVRTVREDPSAVVINDFSRTANTITVSLKAEKNVQLALTERFDPSWQLLNSEGKVWQSLFNHEQQLSWYQTAGWYTLTFSYRPITELLALTISISGTVIAWGAVVLLPRTFLRSEVRKKVG